MTPRRVENDYFNWMINKVLHSERKKASYSKLFDKLHSIEFFWVLDLDGNRAGDGIDLREAFRYEMGYSDIDIKCLDGPCSFLEMLVALSMKCGNGILAGEPFDGVEYCFWEMMRTSHLEECVNRIFSDDKVEEIAYNIMNRDFGPNGEDGLFIVHNPRTDMRNVDFWYQMNWFVVENEP